MRERGGRAVLAPILFAVALAEVLVAVAAGIASDRGWSFLLNHFVVTNAVIGGSLAIAGWPIAWQRPRNCGLADRLAAPTQSDRLAAVGRWRVLCGLGCRVLAAGLGVVRRR